MRDEQTKELYLPLTSMVALKRKQETVYVHLHFDINLRIDALVDSRAYVTAFSRNDLDTKEQKSPSNVLKIDDPPIF